MKRLLSVLISISLLLSFCSVLDMSAFAASNGTCGDSLYWSLNDNGVFTVSGSGRMYDYYDNNLAPWYNQRADIKSVVINSGIANIGSRAFKDCVNLTEVDWGTIDTIGDHAFMGCTSLKHAFLPSGCTWLWNNAFEGCTGLQSAYIPGVNSYSNKIPDGFFKGCTSLGLLGLATGINDMGIECVANCPLRAIITDTADLDCGDIPKIGWSYLSGVCSENTYSNSNLEWHFNLEDCRLWFTGSGDMTGYDNDNHTQPWYRLMGGVNYIDFSTTDAKTSISTCAFQGNGAVERVSFNNIYAIGWGAFAECTGLGSITFDSCLTAIWNYAFANDTSIVYINFTQGNDDLHIYPWAFNNCSGTHFQINLPSNVRYIDDHAFWGTNFNYNFIDNPECVIGDDAFGNGTGGYARFFSTGNRNTTTYTFVKRHRNNHDYNWWYYCKNDAHGYVMTTVAPTCTEQGYDNYACQYCDVEAQKSNYVPALGHSFRFTDNIGLTLYYNCARCGETRMPFSAIDASSNFADALSQTAGNTVFNQSNYDGRADIDVNGVVNAKDFVLLRDILASPSLDGKETTFNTSVTYQTIDGFGASAAWWSQEVGTWNNAEDIIKLLYSPTEGIGLNIYRYNLGGGSEDQQDYGLYVAGARTHCFMQQDGTYNWNNDPGAMNALDIANDLNPDLRITLFANSPPYFMTKNGKTYGALTSNGNGGYKGTENLASSEFLNFADYIAVCAEHFIENGYNVTSVSPINEPEWDWSGWYNGDGTQSSGQEGCHYDEGTARWFYNDYMIPALRNHSRLNGKVDLEVWESGQMNHNWWWSRFLNQCFSKNSSYSGNNANIRSYVDTVDTHSYWAGQDAREAVAAQLSGSDFGQGIRCTEYCQMNTDTTTNVLGHIQAEGGNTNGMTIDYGLALADTMYQDLTILNAKEWDWWTGCGKGIYPDSLVYINDTNHDHIETSKRLWCMGNYSKFIKEGAKRIQVSTGNQFANDLQTDSSHIYTWTNDNGSGTDKYNYLDCSAYLNPNGDVVIVYVNNSDTIEYTKFTDTNFKGFKTYVTDENRNLELVQNGHIGDAVCIPARSVTTAVLEYYGRPAESQSGAYLFTYFTGNAVSEQTIHFAVSTDGYNYTPLNGNNPVITQTLGRQCCRDPYIFKGQDNYYYLIATDMDASGNVWWGNSDTMVIWRSADLINWTNETIISMTDITGANDIQRCWAPQVLWDENEQKYFVYFGLASWSVTQNLTVMYYCYTDDLLDESHYSYPQLLFKPVNNSDKKNAIDGDIIYDSKSETYYLYYKDEDNATICWVKSKNLTGPYEDASAPQKVLNTNVGLEGCNSFFITGTDTLVMLADAYGDGYFVMNQSTDFEHFYPVNSSAFTINNCSPRHGSVIPITNQQYKSLKNHFGY